MPTSFSLMSDVFQGKHERMSVVRCSFVSNTESIIDVWNNSYNTPQFYASSECHPSLRLTIEDAICRGICETFGNFGGDALTRLALEYCTDEIETYSYVLAYAGLGEFKLFDYLDIHHRLQTKKEGYKDDNVKVATPSWNPIVES